jgi:hypothetical protein
VQVFHDAPRDRADHAAVVHDQAMFHGQNSQEPTDSNQNGRWKISGPSSGKSKPAR